jgi:phenylpropionate dioxygenase-like ring-hydroxylating dioxygenase large terminal subunit
MSYLKNAWYVAAWASELTQTELLARKILSQPVVLYRDVNNNPAALIDRCAHRLAPLSMGKIVNSCIECPYHGLRYSSKGECTHNPHGDQKIPARANVQSFPVTERYCAIWIWMGEPEKADVDKIPVFEHMNPENFYVGFGSMNVNAHYLLEVDNIMDLSHIEFVHPMFSSPAVSQGEVSHEIDDKTVWSRRDIYNDTSPPDFIREGFNIPEGPVDRWLHVHWQAPAYMSLMAGGHASGTPKEQAIVSNQVHWFTPETDKTTHYFYALTMPKAFGEDGQAFVDQQTQALYYPFKNEDAPILEGQQNNLGDEELMTQHPIVLNVDAAGNAARKILSKMIEAEAKLQ